MDKIIEQKAKAYDEVLERAKEMIKAMTNIGGVAKVDDIQYLFPELRESEDERIRRSLISYLNEIGNSGVASFNGFSIKEYITYLEKQKEPDGIWTEEDDAKVRVMCKEGDLKPSEIAWLKELKNRIVKKEQKPTEFDEYKIIKKHITEDSLSSEVNKRLTECGWYVSDEKPEEWSEEDEAFLKVAIAVCNRYSHKDIADWLKSLPERFNLQPQAKQEQEEPSDKGEISDGYHTFNELYYYRLLYNAAFFNLLPKEWVHKSKRHHDGEECFGGGWFIVMANLPTGQISNHYEIKDWDLFHIPEKETADEWDGHTPQEAAERLHKFLLEMPDLMPIAWRDIRENEQKPETKLTGWVARDSEYNPYSGLGLILFKEKPRKSYDCWSGVIASHLPWKLFPDLKWKDEPVEVEITIRKK